MVADEDTRLRVRSAYERSLEPGETVYSEGDPGDHLYVIQAGEVELVREAAGEARTIARLGPGDFFGELSAISGGPRSSRAVALDGTRVLALDRETLESVCLGQPEFAIRMIRTLAGRLVEAERRLVLLGVDDLLRPVVRALLRAAEPEASDSGAFAVETTLRRLAADAGLSMLDAHRALHQLFERKLVRLVGDALRVPDLEALSAALEPAD